ncbi:MAG: ABC transporter permease [Candidatus Kariarchaeaceae archaeon]
MRYIYKYTYKILSRRKKRLFFSALAIALGISLIVQTQIITDSLEKTYTDAIIDSFGQVDIILNSMPDAPPYFEQYDTETIYDNIEVANVIPLITETTDVFYPVKGQMEQGVTLWALDPQIDTNYWGSIYDKENTKIDLGQLDVDEVVLSDELVSDLGVELNQNITFRLTNGDGTPFYHNASVSQIYSTKKGFGKSSLLRDNRKIIMNLEALQDIIQSSRREPINSIFISIIDHRNKPFTDDRLVNEIVDKLYELRNGYRIYYYLGINSIRAGIKQGIEAGVDAMSITLNLFGSVVIISGLLLITNIQMMSLKEREQQIGMMRAIGAKKNEILKSYLMENIVLGIFGGLLGLIFGIGIALWMIQLMFELLTGGESVDGGINIVINFGTLTTSLIVALVVSFSTGMIPAIKSQGKSVVEVLHGSRFTLAENKKKSRKSLIIGINISLIGFLTLYANIGDNHPFYKQSGYHDLESEYVSNLFGLFIFSVGLLLLSTRMKRSRIGMTVVGLMMIATMCLGLLIAPGWVKKGTNGNGLLMVSLISGIAGVTTILGVNLEILTAGLRMLLSTMQATRDVGLVATRYVNYRKSRAVVTFSTFAVVLSLNFFMGSLGASQQHGFYDVWEDYMHNAPVMIQSSTPINLTDVNYTAIIQNQDSFNRADEVKNIFPLQTSTGSGFVRIGPSSFRGTSFKMVSINETAYKKEGHALYPYHMSQIIEAFSKFNFLDRQKSRDKLLEESNNFWDAFLSGVKLNRDTLEPIYPGDGEYDMSYALPILIGNGLLYGFNVEVGDIITFRDAHTGYTTVDMVYAADISFFPSFALPASSNRGMIFSASTASKIDAFNIANAGYTEFIVETIHGYDEEKNDDLCMAIEKFSNIDLIQSTGNLYGIEAHNLWNLVDELLEQQVRTYTFIQWFVSTGLIIGVFGFMIVSHRSVSERKREIGMLRSIGFDKKSVALAVLLELLFLGVMGFIVGFIVGNFITWAFTSILGIEFIIPWITVLMYGGLIIGSVIIAAIIPGWQATRIPPSDALRYRG